MIGFLRSFASRPSTLIGLLVFLSVVVIALIADWLYPGSPFRMVARPNLPPLSTGYLMGTDMLGRDLTAALVHGSRVTLSIAILATLLTVAIGTIIGAISGYYGAIVDDTAMRVTEFFQAIPSFLFAIVLVAVVSPSRLSIVLAIAIVSWPSVARLVRAEVLTLRTRDFVRAARVGGLSDMRILFSHILPNAMSPLLVSASVVMATAILIESGISFLGLGDRNAVSWGYLIGTGRTAVRINWWLSALPGFAIFLTVWSLNLVGDGLSTWLDPRKTETGRHP
ncbi:ABC transporter permease [Bradyrhizobium sp. LHD-71]|uniref:ABC transporter permease n=1 Tax=Bradyrhizobium sp. LHD-71 TaxID=3072141 RepID=UPI00280F1D31|nr:ABC transporter permease [Bradyrhizobium sp. LHD-71]MDQ8731584.1 ABC transporter permease [Bradyrhizobium sp. LHD-71]